MVTRSTPKPWRLPEETLVDWAKQAKLDAEARPNLRMDTAAVRDALTQLREQALHVRNFDAAALLRRAWLWTCRSPSIEKAAFRPRWGWCPATKEQAAQAVVDGFYHAGIDTTLDRKNVLKIFSRQ